MDGPNPWPTLVEPTNAAAAADDDDDVVCDVAVADFHTSVLERLTLAGNESDKRLRLKCHTINALRIVLMLIYYQLTCLLACVHRHFRRRPKHNTSQKRLRYSSARLDLNLPFSDVRLSHIMASMAFGFLAWFLLESESAIVLPTFIYLDLLATSVLVPSVSAAAENYNLRACKHNRMLIWRRLPRVSLILISFTQLFSVTVLLTFCKTIF